MNVDSIHKTLIRILIVIWVSGIAIVAVDLLVLDKEKKAWNELKPITHFSFHADNTEVRDLRAQHNKYMTEGILPARPDVIATMPLPSSMDEMETARNDDNTIDETTLSIDDILLEAKQAELATQIEPASGDLSTAFLKEAFQDNNIEVIDNNDMRDVLEVIHDLDVYDNARPEQEDMNEPVEDDIQEKTEAVIAPPPEPKMDYAYIEPKGKGQVVIIIDDMGVSLRSKVVEVMDGPLTLAYLPYAKDLPERTKRAKSNGHELMVHMPMEAMNRSLDGGPKVLRTSTNDKDFQDTVNWGLSQFDGYVGLNNHMGSRLTKDKAAMKHLMSLIKGRDLYFIDSKTIGSSVAAETAKEYGIPYAERDVFLDHEISKEFVRNALKKLEAMAYQKGYAIAIGHPHKETVEVLKEWIPTLKEKGLTLVPASAVIKQPVSSHNDMAINETY